MPVHACVKARASSQAGLLRVHSSAGHDCGVSGHRLPQHLQLGGEHALLAHRLQRALPWGAWSFRAHRWALRAVHVCVPHPPAVRDTWLATQLRAGRGCHLHLAEFGTGGAALPQTQHSQQAVLPVVRILNGSSGPQQISAAPTAAWRLGLPHLCAMNLAASLGPASEARCSRSPVS